MLEELPRQLSPRRAGTTRGFPLKKNNNPRVLIDFLPQKHLLPPLIAADATDKSASRTALVKSLVKLIVKLPDASRDRLLVALSFGLAAIVQQLRAADATLDLSGIEKVLKVEQQPPKVVEQNGTGGGGEPPEAVVAMVTE